MCPDSQASFNQDFSWTETVKVKVGQIWQLRVSPDA